MDRIHQRDLGVAVEFERIAVHVDGRGFVIAGRVLSHAGESVCVAPLGHHAGEAFTHQLGAQAEKGDTGGLRFRSDIVPEGRIIKHGFFAVTLFEQLAHTDVPASVGITAHIVEKSFGNGIAEEVAETFGVTVVSQ